MTTLNIERYQEPEITINGVPLGEGASMTVRVALESFAADLALNGLGNNEHGVKMCELYLARIAEIRRLLYRTAK